MLNNRVTLLAVLCCGVLMSGCGLGEKKAAAATTSGDPDRGASLISSYGCGSCHTIPGIIGAHGLVGPALAGLRNRLYVAGMLPNETANLVRWIEDPRSINEKTVMPNLGVTSRDSTDIAAYLYSLK